MKRRSLHKKPWIRFPYFLMSLMLNMSVVAESSATSWDMLSPMEVRKVAYRLFLSTQLPFQKATDDRGDLKYILQGKGTQSDGRACQWIFDYRSYGFRITVLGEDSQVSTFSAFNRGDDKIRDFAVLADRYEIAGSTDLWNESNVDKEMRRSEFHFNQSLALKVDGDEHLVGVEVSRNPWGANFISLEGLRGEIKGSSAGCRW